MPAPTWAKRRQPPRSSKPSAVEPHQVKRASDLLAAGATVPPFALGVVQLWLNDRAEMTTRKGVVDAARQGGMGEGVL